MPKLAIVTDDFYFLKLFTRGSRNNILQIVALSAIKNILFQLSLLSYETVVKVNRPRISS